MRDLHEADLDPGAIGAPIARAWSSPAWRFITRTPLLIALALATLFPLAAARHPFHVSIAEAEVARADDGVKVLQVALRVDPDDLENALEMRAHTRLHLDTTENIDALIKAYLDDVFQVRHPSTGAHDKPEPLDPCPPPPPPPDTNASKPGASSAAPPAANAPPGSPRPGTPGKKHPSIIRWVGKDLGEIRYVWLYFEICLPESGVDGLEFSSRIFFEFAPEQVNTINFREGDWRSSLRFTPEDTWHVLRRDAAPPGHD